MLEWERLPLSDICFAHDRAYESREPLLESAERPLEPR